jgi:hypothetical protein
MIDNNILKIKTWYNPRTDEITYYVDDAELETKLSAGCVFLINVTEVPITGINTMLKNTKVLTGVSKTFLRGVSRLVSIGTVFSIASVGYDVSAYSRKEIPIEQLIGSITITTITFAATSVLAGLAISGGAVGTAVAGVGTMLVLTSSILASTIGEEKTGRDIIASYNKIEDAMKTRKWQDKLNAMYLCEETDPTHPFGTAATMQKVDPIALDLNGDGITFGSATDGYAQFDLDNNGFKERAAWLNNAQDGFLARDINGNGLIDDGSELFGDQNGTERMVKCQQLALKHLKDLDDNKDGILDKLDKAFSER